MTHPSPLSTSPGLQRKLSLFDTALLVIGSVLGSGIFLTTGYIAELVPSPLQILGIWLLGGLMTLCGAMTFAELGALFPQAGGQYVYLREAYGTFSGFLFGWAFFWVIECGGIAALAVGFAEYFGYFFPALSTDNFLLQIHPLGFSYSLSSGQIVAVVTLIGLSIVNYFGIKSGAWFQNFFTIIKVLAVSFLVIGGLISIAGKSPGPTRDLISQDIPFPSGGFDFRLFGLALIAVFWTYDGWYSVSCTAEEIRNPKRNIPLGLFLGTLGITFIYFFINLFYIKALSIEQMSGVSRIAELASEFALGPRAAFYISALITVSIFGCLSATVIYGPRVYYAMAKDGVFFKAMAYVHPRYHVPTKSIAWQAVWSGLLCLTGTFQALYEYVVFTLMIFFAATGIAVIVLRRKFPGRHRPYKVWAYPVLPLVFILINIVVLLNTVQAQPGQSFIGLVILGLGIPYYLRKKRRLDRISPHGEHNGEQLES